MATERAYTAAEIDDLRMACENKWLWGSYKSFGSVGGFSRQWKGSEKDVAVEAMVRTHMLAGHTAEDLWCDCKTQSPSD